MSGYILCQTRKAGTPYYIENIRTNIYTIEELCYYLYHNLYLLDQSIFNEEFCNWIQNELNLPQLAAKIRPRIGKFASEADILYPIFKEINYLTYEELKQLNQQLTRLEQETKAVREKKKGDTLMKNEMYVQAMHVYQSLLERGELEKDQTGLGAAVCYNLGCAYSYLFQMEKAVECFNEAYRRSGKREHLKSYLLAYRSIHTPIEYGCMLREFYTEEGLMDEIKEDLERFARKPEPQVYVQHVDQILENLTRDYHRSTGA